MAAKVPFKAYPFAKGRRQWPLLLIACVVTGTMVGMRQLGLSQPLELAIYDWFLRSHRAIAPDPRILIVEITESDIQRHQTWPFSDELIGRLLSQLQQHHPAAVGLDLYRDFHHPPGEKLLKQQLQRTNVISIEKLGGPDTYHVPAPKGVPRDQIGFNDFVVDPDGIVRRNFLFATVGEIEYYSLSLRLSQLYLAKKHPEISPELEISSNAVSLGNTEFKRLRANAGAYQGIDNGGYQLLLRYRTPHLPAQRISISDILDNNFDPAWINNKIVLIGTTALSEKDYFYTPYGSSEANQLVMPGVVVHAHLTSQIISATLGERSLYRFWPDFIEIIWIGLWALAGSILIYRFDRPRILSAISLVSVCSISIIALFSLTQGIWIPCAMPLLSFSMAGTIALVYKEFYRSFFDELTGLSNRTFFMRNLEKLLKGKQAQAEINIAVLFIDIDQFTLINENFGRAAGDELLRIITARLRASLPSKSKLAKLDGDDFVVVLKQCPNLKLASQLADRMQENISRPITFKRQNLRLTASIGIAMSEAGSHKQAEAIVRDAQMAMYRAKSMGKACYEIFSAQMRTQSATLFSLNSDLPQAIEQNQLRLHYQPLIHLESGKIQGFEALVRWQHPKKGLIYPGDFIPLAEENGLIVPLGYWVLKEACRQNQLWNQAYPQATTPLFISVNLSGRQFRDPHLIENIQKIIEDVDLLPHSLKLELTESVVMDDVEVSVNGLLSLKKINIKVGIDDFGTGYSSLSYLHRFPVDTLKVDRSFVMRMHDASDNEAIVKTIISLSHSLQMDVIAEGIETAAQAEKLKTWNCEYGQGYFFSRPVPSEKAEALLANPPHWAYPQDA
ncbi:EAL domain-containing protein [Leptothoe kymatousa]|uniref:EAL domain-containing protein n=1 Tax=Leptothoe kymatousa TaxID=2651727 RepID=UPI001C030C50|nr:EAL domain-containing protein [Leptothoe kymatousa]